VITCCCLRRELSTQGQPPIAISLRQLTIYLPTEQNHKIATTTQLVDLPTAPQTPKLRRCSHRAIAKGTLMAPLLQHADRCVLLIGTRRECPPRIHQHRQDVLARGFDLVEQAARAAPAHLAVRCHLPDPRRWACSLRSFWRFLCIDLGHAALLTWSQGRGLALTSRVATRERQSFRATQASHLPLAAKVCPGRCR
jgi:hypothetical protein